MRGGKRERGKEREGERHREGERASLELAGQAAVCQRDATDQCQCPSSEPLRPPAKRASLLCKGGCASPKYCEHKSHMALSTMCSIQNPQSMSPHLKSVLQMHLKHVVGTE